MAMIVAIAAVEAHTIPESPGPVSLDSYLARAIERASGGTPRTARRGLAG